MRHLFHFTAQVIQSKCVSMFEHTHCLISSDERSKDGRPGEFLGESCLCLFGASTLCVADRHFHSWVEALWAQPSHLSRRTNCVFYFLSSPVLFFWQNLRGFKVRIWFDAPQWVCRAAAASSLKQCIHSYSTAWTDTSKPFEHLSHPVSLEALKMWLIKCLMSFTTSR